VLVAVEIITIAVIILRTSRNGMAIAIWTSRMSFHYGKWGSFVMLFFLLSQ
jgi:hypothetical protein